ncbi:MAG: lycopene cyclase [Rickettsiales bacterium]|nr:lycopene cyclase [Rickettsiales bacterium]|tara:strand:+ start:1990 stop:3150 length:1161 start_codon:yes stop_codon:yes gene_type:complete
MTQDADIIIAGAGLAGLLLAAALRERHPHLSLLLIEPDEPGGNHTWCFHEGDVSASQFAMLKPMLAASWPGYDVIFPDHHRHLSSAYHCLTAETMRHALLPSLESCLRRGHVTAVNARSVTLHTGATLSATQLFDARGWQATDMVVAWQIFTGIEVETTEPHGLTQPIIMDATVPQCGGYRFFYSLPLSPTRLLIEDTRYVETPHFDMDAMIRECEAYADSKGWQIATIIRSEKGALPLVLDGQLPETQSNAIPLGMRAGLFHPVTGYSLPDTMRMIEQIVTAPDLLKPSLPRSMTTYRQHRWQGHWFYRLLNRLLFLAGAPDMRWKILSRFYTLPESLIARFYAGNNTPFDMLRILAGKPPVPVMGALRSLPPSAAGQLKGTQPS